MRVTVTNILYEPKLRLSSESLGRAIAASHFIAVLIQGPLSRCDLEELAKRIAFSGPEVVAVWGDYAEELHDLVDEECVRRTGCGPLTVWETDALSTFLWNLIVVYKGLNSDIEDVSLQMILVSSDVEFRGQVLRDLRRFQKQIDLHLA
jgi:hypothetical protein